MSMNSKGIYETEVYMTVRRPQADGTKKIVYQGVVARTKFPLWYRIKRLFYKLVG